MTLVVNGREWFGTDVGIWLSGDGPFWLVTVRPGDAIDHFARTLPPS